MSEKTAADNAQTHSERADEDRKAAATASAPVEEGVAAETCSDMRNVEAELAAATAKAEENWNQYLRAVAELDNTRKRAERDIEQTRRYALERFAADLLPVRDSLEMGLTAASDAQDKAGALVEGTEMTLRQLTQVFEKFGITEINPLGEKFDPQLHEAMAAQPSMEAEPDTVLTVVQKGYLLNGRVLRAARVLVARRPDGG